MNNRWEGIVEAGTVDLCPGCGAAYRGDSHRASPTCPNCRRYWLLPVWAREAPAATPLRVVSGGQTGVDQVALLAARSARVATGGWAPKGWETEAGPAPWLAWFGVKAFPAPGYPARTAANVRDSDATLWLGSTDSSGFRATRREVDRLGRPFAVADLDDEGESLRRLVGGPPAAGPFTLNVAGNRASRDIALGARAFEYLVGPLRGYAAAT